VTSIVCNKHLIKGVNTASVKHTWRGTLIEQEKD